MFDQKKMSRQGRAHLRFYILEDKSVDMGEDIMLGLSVVCIGRIRFREGFERESGTDRKGMLLETFSKGILGYFHRFNRSREK